MNIHGFNKTTLLDYPGLLASTVFTGGCNLRCPFCHNGDLVLHPEIYPAISEEEVLEHLRKRANIIKGVCITGGEPTLQKDLPAFIDSIKSVGLKVKLDTNGFNPDCLSELIHSGSLDYIAMDIKGGRSGYGNCVGIKDIDIKRFDKSIELIMSSSVPYEFRTTAVKGLHTEEDFLDIREWISNAGQYYIQSYTYRDTVIDKKCSAFTKEELEHFINIVRSSIPAASLRGVD
ncbi:MAG: anaerobic ribonucleoside-triphosphate reductase activating protein [Lachnospiraceae bacterium]|nr:anaerobic ribonucleoside-triphosphate reductase activating protein [Lachnospiraceae bacterium]